MVPFFCESLHGLASGHVTVVDGWMTFFLLCPMAGRKVRKALRPRFRVICGKDIALGPGKVELLRAVAQVGSLNEAAKRLGMSYMRAWMLVKTMNRCFREPVLIAERGGKSGGGMRVTESGRRALSIYDEIEAGALASAKGSWQRLQRLLRS